jgi:phage-related protein
VADRTLKVTIIGDAGSAIGALSQTEAAAGSLEAKVGGVQGALSTLSPVFLGIGAATVGLFGTAISDAANFEQTMSNVKAVSGETGTTFDEMRKLAIDMGAQTAFSAQEAAEGLEELIKGGLDADTAMEALKSTLDLAAAGEISVGEAATIASNAINQFGLDGTAMTSVANDIAGAANASALSVSDFNLSLAAVGAVAHLAGQDFHDTAVAIALMGQNGITGSDAGTTLKTMLLNLIPTTQTAKEAFAELGITHYNNQKIAEALVQLGVDPLTMSQDEQLKKLYELTTGWDGIGAMTKDQIAKWEAVTESMGLMTNEFVNADGSFKSLAEVSQILNEKTQGLSESQKAMYLEMMFGSDAVRAATILANEGAAGWTAMAEGMAKVTAADVAATKLDNLKGSLEALKGSLETIGIIIGSAFLPALRGLTDVLTTVANAFITLDPEMQTTIATVALVVGAIAGALGVWGMFGPQIMAAAQAFVYLAGVLGGPLLIAAAAAGALWFAWENNFLGIRDRVNEAAAAFQALAAPLADQIWTEMVATWDRLVVAAGNLEDALTQSGPPADAFKAVLYLIADVLPALTGPIDTLVGLFDRLRLSSDPLATALGDIRTYIAGLDFSWRDLTAAFSTGSTVFGVVAAVLGGPLTLALGAIAVAVGALYLAWQEDWGGIRGAVEPVMATLTQLGAWVTGTAIPAFQQFGATLLGIWQGEIVPLAQQFAAAVMGGVGGALTAIIPLVQNLGAAFQANMPAILQLWDQLQQTFAAVQPLLEPLFYLLGFVFLTQIGATMGALGGLVGFLTGALPGAIQAATGVLQVFEGIFTWLSATVTGVINVVSALLRGDWAGAWDAAKTAANEAAAGVQQIFEGLKNTIIGIFNGLAGGILGALQGFWNTVIGFFQGVYKELVGESIIPDLINKIVEWFGKLPGMVLAALGDLANTLYQKGRDLVGGLAGGVAEVWGTLASNFQNAGATILGYLGDTGRTLWDKGGDLIRGLLGGVGEIWGTVVANFQNAGASIAGYVGDLAGALLQKGRDLIGGFLAGVGEAWGTVATNFANVGFAVIGYVGDVARALWQKGVDIVDGFTAGVWDKWQWVVTFFGDVGGSVLGFIGDTLQTLYDKGKDLGQGLINGVKDALAGLKDIVVAALNEVITAYNNIMPGTQFDLPTIGGGGGTAPAPGGGGAGAPGGGGGGGFGQFTPVGFPIGGGAGGGGVTLIVNNYGLTVPEVAEQLHNYLRDLLEGGATTAPTVPGGGAVTVN